MVEAKEMQPFLPRGQAVSEGRGVALGGLRVACLLVLDFCRWGSPNFYLGGTEKDLNRFPTWIHSKCFVFHVFSCIKQKQCLIQT